MKILKENDSIENIKQTYNAPGSIRQKIQALKVARRRNQGNREIEDECNKYLTKLYKREDNGETTKEGSFPGSHLCC